LRQNIRPQAKLAVYCGFSSYLRLHPHFTEITNIANLSVSNVTEKGRFGFLFCSCLFSVLFPLGAFQLLLMQLLRSLISKTLYIASAAY
jgi:hypothetical protein